MEAALRAVDEGIQGESDSAEEDDEFEKMMEEALKAGDKEIQRESDSGGEHDAGNTESDSGAEEEGEDDIKQRLYDEKMEEIASLETEIADLIACGELANPLLKARITKEIDSVQQEVDRKESYMAPLRRWRLEKEIDALRNDTSLIDKRKQGYRLELASKQLEVANLRIAATGTAEESKEEKMEEVEFLRKEIAKYRRWRDRATYFVAKDTCVRELKRIQRALVLR